MTDRVRSLERETVLDQLGAVSPAFVAGPGRPIGALDRAVLEAWARWAQRFGIVERRPDVGAMFVPRYANAGDPRSSSGGRRARTSSRAAAPAFVKPMWM
jgi:hypothetical protein